MMALLAAALLLTADLAQSLQDLKSPEEKERRAAVQALAKEGSKQAWTAVVGALSDPQAMVADEAQLQLKECTAADARMLLLGKEGIGSGEENLRLRALEVLKSWKGALEAAPILKLAADKNVDLRRAACTALELRAGDCDERGRKSALAVLGNLQSKDKESEIRARAFLAAYALAGEGGTELLLAAGKSADPLVLAASVGMLQHSSDAGAWTRREALAKHAHRIVRRAVVADLEQIPSAEAVDLLVRMLQDEKDLRLSWSIAEALEAHTGVRNGIVTASWIQWWSGVKADWKPEDKRKPERRKAGDYEGTAVFAGLPVISDRVVILFDMSGSMWEPRADGKTRKQVVEIELERTLKALPTVARFNLIPYTRQPIPFEKGLVAASPDKVKQGIEWFRGLKDAGKGNVWDALVLALSDPEVDTILLFSDGAPSGGKRWNVELIGESFAERNRLRHVALDHVLVGAPRGLIGAWKRISEASGGRLLEFEMP
jgi:HEAT repeat protein